MTCACLAHPVSLRSGLTLLLTLLLMTLLTRPAWSAEDAGVELLDLQSPATLAAAKPSSKQVTLANSNEPSAPGLVVSIAPGDDGYPGVGFAQQPPLDLSAHGHVAVRVTNLSDAKVTVSLRVDNAGDWRTNPWNSENLALGPQATGTCVVRFGYSWGKPAFALNPAKITNILLFTGKVKAEAGIKFRIEAVTAGGKPGEAPPVKPADVRLAPKDGWLLGSSVQVDGEKQLAARGADVAVEMIDGQPALQFSFPRIKGGTPTATFKPAQGAWDLRQYLQLRVTLYNSGRIAVSPKVRLDSKGGSTDWAEPEKALAPGEAVEVVVPFIGKELWSGDKKDSGNRVTSDAGTGVTVAVNHAADGDYAVQVRAIRAELPPTKLPDWLGSRPPVEGDWVQTLNEEFDSDTLNDRLWRIYAPNYWDKRSHFSKDNLVLGGGMMRLRMEKKTGFHNDDPTQKQTDYAVGFMDSYGKWAQRYGYFEARMKVPTAPGLWPAFWMMPDRGVEAGPQWKRQDTGNGGMELDIYEHLTRWGPLRYNLALHWDGYQKNHKATGSSRVYHQLDQDGFVVAGLLWLPGKAVFYANGQEVGRWENERISSVRSVLMFDMVTGGWDNNALDDKQLPADFVIDWVRAWQRKDLASDQDGYMQPGEQ